MDNIGVSNPQLSPWGITLQKLHPRHWPILFSEIPVATKVLAVSMIIIWIFCNIFWPIRLMIGLVPALYAFDDKGFGSRPKKEMRIDGLLFSTSRYLFLWNIFSSGFYHAYFIDVRFPSVKLHYTLHQAPKSRYICLTWTHLFPFILPLVNHPTLAVLLSYHFGLRWKVLRAFLGNLRVYQVHFDYELFRWIGLCRLELLGLLSDW